MKYLVIAQIFAIVILLIGVALKIDNLVHVGFGGYLLVFFIYHMTIKET